MTLLKKQSGFALPSIIFITAVLIIAGGVGYYFYKTSQEQKEQVVDETADWKTYWNEIVGYELKYPKDWSFEEGGAPRSPTFSYHWNENSYCQFDIVVTPVDYSGEMAWYKEKGYKETRYTIGGVPAIGFSKSSERKGSEAQHIFFDKNSNYYRITQSNSKGAHETECLSIFNQILPTFKFTK